MHAVSSSPLSRKGFVSSVVLLASGLSIPSISHADSFSSASSDREERCWTESYRDDSMVLFESGEYFKALNLASGEETLAHYQDLEGCVRISTASGVSHFAEVDPEGNLYIDDELVLAAAEYFGQEAVARRGCVKISEYDTTLSANSSTDDVIIGALSFLPFYGWVLGLVGFAKTVFQKVGNRGEVYFHCVRYYCDAPVRQQKLITYAYSDAAHKHLIDTHTQTYAV